MRHLDKLGLDRIRVPNGNALDPDPHFGSPGSIRKFNSVNAISVALVLSLSKVNIVINVVSIVSDGAEALNHEVVSL